MVNLADHLWPGQHQQVVIPFEIVRVIAEPLAAEIGLRQPIALNHRSHRAIEQQDAFGEKLVKTLGGGHRALFLPLAIKTANGSPALLAPMPTRTSDSPAPRSRISSCDPEKPRCRSPKRFRTHV